MRVAIGPCRPFEILGLWYPAKRNFTADIAAWDILVRTEGQGFAAKTGPQIIHKIADVFPPVPILSLIRQGGEQIT
jgi:hypothetical protein